MRYEVSFWEQRSGTEVDAEPGTAPYWSLKRRDDIKSAANKYRKQTFGTASMDDNQLVHCISVRLSLDDEVNLRADVFDLGKWASNGRIYTCPPRPRFSHSRDACTWADSCLALDGGCVPRWLKTLPAAHNDSVRNYRGDRFNSHIDLHSVFMVAMPLNTNSQLKD